MPSDCMKDMCLKYIKVPYFILNGFYLNYLRDTICEIVFKKFRTNQFLLLNLQNLRKKAMSLNQNF